MNKSKRNLILAIFSTILFFIIIMLVTVGQYLLGMCGLSILIGLMLKLVVEKE